MIPMRGPQRGSQGGDKELGTCDRHDGAHAKKAGCLNWVTLGSSEDDLQPVDTDTRVAVARHNAGLTQSQDRRVRDAGEPTVREMRNRLFSIDDQSLPVRQVLPAYAKYAASTSETVEQMRHRLFKLEPQDAPYAQAKDDAYTEGYCERCGRKREECERLRKKYGKRCVEIPAEAKDESAPHKFEVMPGNKPGRPCNRCLELKSHPNHDPKRIEEYKKMPRAKDEDPDLIQPVPVRPVPTPSGEHNERGWFGGTDAIDDKQRLANIKSTIVYLRKKYDAAVQRGNRYAIQEVEKDLRNWMSDKEATERRIAQAKDVSALDPKAVQFTNGARVHNSKGSVGEVVHVDGDQVIVSVAGKREVWPLVKTFRAAGAEDDTDVEYAVLSLLGQGKTLSSIANLLNVPLRQVELVFNKSKGKDELFPVTDTEWNDPKARGPYKLTTSAVLKTPEAVAEAYGKKDPAGFARQFGKDSFGPDHLNAAEKAIKAGLTMGQFLRSLPGYTKMTKERLEAYSKAYHAVRTGGKGPKGEARDSRTAPVRVRDASGRWGATRAAAEPGLEPVADQNPDASERAMFASYADKAQKAKRKKAAKKAARTRKRNRARDSDVEEFKVGDRVKVVATPSAGMTGEIIGRSGENWRVEFANGDIGSFAPRSLAVIAGTTDSARARDGEQLHKGEQVEVRLSGTWIRGVVLGLSSVHGLSYLVRDATGREAMWPADNVRKVGAMANDANEHSSADEAAYQDAERRLARLRREGASVHELKEAKASRDKAWNKIASPGHGRDDHDEEGWDPAHAGSRRPLRPDEDLRPVGDGFLYGGTGKLGPAFTAECEQTQKDLQMLEETMNNEVVQEGLVSRAMIWLARAQNQKNSDQMRSTSLVAARRDLASAKSRQISDAELAPV